MGAVLSKYIFSYYYPMKVMGKPRGKQVRINFILLVSYSLHNVDLAFETKLQKI